MSLLADAQQLLGGVTGIERLRQSTVVSIDIESNGADNRKQQPGKNKPLQIALGFRVIEKAG